MDKFIEEEITLHEFADRFLNFTNYSTPMEIDVSHFNIEVETNDLDGNMVYAPLSTFVIKPIVPYYYTDGKIKVSPDHKFVSGSMYKKAKYMEGFYRVDEPLEIVDIGLSDYHTYIANGHLNHNTTSGGKAIPFHSSVRVFLKSMGKIEGEINGTKTPVGMKTRAIIKKNRLGPPLRTTEYDIYFDRGIDDYSSWGEVLKSMGLLKASGYSVTYEYIDTETGEVTTLPKFKLSELEQVLADKPEIKKQMYQLICENYIMKYNTSQNLETSFSSEDEY